MVGLVTFDEVLRFFFRGVVKITLDTHTGNGFPKDYPTDSPSF